MIFCTRWFHKLNIFKSTIYNSSQLNNKVNPKNIIVKHDIKNDNKIINFLDKKIYASTIIYNISPGNGYLYTQYETDSESNIIGSDFNLSCKQKLDVDRSVFKHFHYMTHNQLIKEFPNVHIKSQSPYYQIKYGIFEKGDTVYLSKLEKNNGIWYYRHISRIPNYHKYFLTDAIGFIIFFSLLILYWICIISAYPEIFNSIHC